MTFIHKRSWISYICGAIMNLKNILPKLKLIIFTYPILFYTFCFSICCYQISQMCQIYFNYHTITSVSYEHDQLIVLPGATVCIKKQYVVKDEYKKSSEEEILATINRMTVRDQFRALLTIDQILESCEVMKPLYMIDVKTPYVNCSQLSPIKRSIDYLRLCLVVLTQDFWRYDSSKRPVVENVRSFRDFAPALIRMQFNKTVPEVEIVLHNRFEVIHNYYNHYFQKLVQLDDFYQFFRLISSSSINFLPN